MVAVFLTLSLSRLSCHIAKILFNGWIYQQVSRYTTQALAATVPIICQK